MATEWFFKNGCNFMKIVSWCLVPCVLPYGSDVLVDVRFKIRGWGEKGLHVVSACCYGSYVGTLLTWDANVAG